MARLRQFLNPADREFFELFEQAAVNAAAGAERLEHMIRGFPDTAAVANEIRDLEHEGDRLTHELLQRLNRRTSATLDREDALRLASTLDDVIDLIEEVADLLVLYKIEAPTAQAETLAQILLEATREVTIAMPGLRDPNLDLAPRVVEIHRLENDGDRVSREAVASLFDAGVDPLFVIRWKDVYERLEDAIDATERVAVVLEGIVIKRR